MDCFTGLIGLRDHCGEDIITSSSGLYINDLPGISIDGVDRKVNREYESAVDAIRKQMAVAEKILIGRARRALASKHEVTTLIDHHTAGEWKEQRSAQSAQAYKVGIQVKVPGAAQTDLSVSRVSLLVNFSGSVEVKMWDLFTGEQLQSQTITAVAGQEVVAQVAWTRKADGKPISVFIGYDATSVPTWQSSLGNKSCNCSGGHANLRYAHLYTKKVAGSVLNGNLERQSGTSGLSIDLSLTCSMEHVLCAQSQLMALPLWYKTGEQLLTFMRFSDTLSLAGIAFNADYQELAPMYAEDFEAHLQDVVQKIRLPKGPCFSCKNLAKTAVRI